MSAIKILFILAFIFAAHAQTISVGDVQLISTALSNNCAGQVCTRPTTACTDLTTIFDRLTCCPTCYPDTAAVATRIRQFYIDHRNPCNDTDYAALQQCWDPTNVTASAIVVANPLAFWARLQISGPQLGCPTCRHPRITRFLERLGRAVSSRLPCNRTEFQACVQTRPRCRAGEIPLPTDDSCCTYPCVPSEALCRIEDVHACMRKQPECGQNEYPTFDENQCCPSCRPPRPVCQPICGDDESCVWVRQPPTDRSTKRQVLDPLRPASYDPTTVVPRALCRPRRAVRLILRNLVTALRRAGSADPENIRILIVAAVRRWCLQGKMAQCGNGLLDVLSNIVVADVQDVTVSATVETHVTLHFSGLSASVETTLQAAVTANLQALPGTLSAVTDPIVAFLLKALQAIVDEANQLNAGLTVTVPPFIIARVDLPDASSCRTALRNGCNVSSLPVCNRSNPISIDPVTCCPSCKRDTRRDPPPPCQTFAAVNCTRDLDVLRVEPPRVDPATGCFHCLPRTERSDVARCAYNLLKQSFRDGPVCREWQIDPDRVSLVRDAASVAIRGIPDTVKRCTGRCFHPLAKCSLEDRIMCRRNQPACAAGQLPEIADGACCATCRITRPTCSPACTFPQICVRNRTDDTTSCKLAVRYRLKLALAAAIKARIGDFTREDVAEVIDHLIHSCDHHDTAERVDSIRERLHAIRDNIDSYDSVTATATIYILVDDTPSQKRQGQTYNGGNVIQDSCGQQQADGTFTECTLTPDSTTTGTSSSSTTGGSSSSSTGSSSSSSSSSSTGSSSSSTGTPVSTTGTTPSPAPTSSSGSPVGMAVALLLCFVASFLMIVM